jgi:hypothetical protein
MEMVTRFEEDDGGEKQKMRKKNVMMGSVRTRAGHADVGERMAN